MNNNNLFLNIFLSCKEEKNTGLGISKPFDSHYVAVSLWVKICGCCRTGPEAGETCKPWGTLFCCLCNYTLPIQGKCHRSNSPSTRTKWHTFNLTGVFKLNYFFIFFAGRWWLRQWHLFKQIYGLLHNKYLGKFVHLCNTHCVLRQLGIIKFYYMAVSQGLETTKFTNLIGWNQCWKQPRFSHLDWHLNR